MAGTKKYKVEYRASFNVSSVPVVAKNAPDAYMKAVYKVIPAKEGELPYSAWVSSVTYSNGKVKYFNNFEGKPF